MLPLMPTAPSGSNIYRPLSVTQASAADEPDKSHETQPQTLSGRVNMLFLFFNDILIPVSLPHSHRRIGWL